MAYLSCDMSLKISANGTYHHTNSNHGHNDHPKTGGAEGYLRYIGRDVDLTNGRDCYGYHDSIDLGRTEQNETYYRDKDGVLQPCTDTQQMIDAYNRRIDQYTCNRHIKGKTVQLHGKQALKGNSCVMRPVVVQGGDTPGFVTDAVTYLEQRCGRDNIVAVSVHRDEQSVHLHFALVPLTADCRLDQSKVLPSKPAQMQQFHRDFREYMRAHGHDIELDNKPDDENTIRDDKGRKERTTKAQRAHIDQRIEQETDKQVTEYKRRVSKVVKRTLDTAYADADEIRRQAEVDAQRIRMDAQRAQDAAQAEIRRQRREAEADAEKAVEAITERERAVTVRERAEDKRERDNSKAIALGRRSDVNKVNVPTRRRQGIDLGYDY